MNELYHLVAGAMSLAVAMALDPEFGRGFFVILAVLLAVSMAIGAVF